MLSYIASRGETEEPSSQFIALFDPQAGANKRIKKRAVPRDTLLPAAKKRDVGRVSKCGSSTVQPAVASSSVLSQLDTNRCLTAQSGSAPAFDELFANMFDSEMNAFPQ